MMVCSCVSYIVLCPLRRLKCLRGESLQVMIDEKHCANVCPGTSRDGLARHSHGLKENIRLQTTSGDLSRTSETSRRTAKLDVCAGQVHNLV